MNSVIRKVMRSIVTKQTASQINSAKARNDNCNYSNNYYGDQCCECALK